MANVGPAMDKSAVEKDDVASAQARSEEVSWFDGE